MHVILKHNYTNPVAKSCCSLTAKIQRCNCSFLKEPVLGRFTLKKYACRFNSSFFLCPYFLYSLPSIYACSLAAKTSVACLKICSLLARCAEIPYVLQFLTFGSFF
jgi:hypothetical protein